MGLLDFRKPKWQHKDPAVRLQAVADIEPQETEILAALGRDDDDQRVRQAAIGKLIDLETLDRLAEDGVPADQQAISARRDLLLYDQIANSAEIEDGLHLLTRLNSPVFLAKLAVNSKHPAFRLAAVKRIEDQLLLAEIVRQKCGKEPAKEAMARIDDEKLLADLCENAASKTARRMAAEKLAELAQQKIQPDPDELVKRTLSDLAAEAAQIRSIADIDQAAARLIAIKAEWHKLDSGGKHPDHDTFSRICLDFETRYQEIKKLRKIEEEKSVRYEQFQAGLDEICGTIERLITSPAADAVALREQAEVDWATLQGDPEFNIAPSASMVKRFTGACQAFDLNRQKIKQEKEELALIENKCRAARDLIGRGNLPKGADLLAAAVKSLNASKFKYFNDTPIQQQVTEAKAELALAQKEVREQNLAKRREICAELTELAGADIHHKSEKILQTFRQAWEQLPLLDDLGARELEQRYQEAVSDLTEKLKAFEHEQDWQLWANLSLKEKLTEKVIALDQQDDLENVFKVVTESQLEWKQIGPVPPKKSQRLWDKFHTACNRNFERTEPYLLELKNKRAEALVRRREICVLAAELAESTAWQKTAEAIKSLQEEWKNLPHGGSRRQENELYQEFRGFCDRFFERRKEDYQSREEERRSNLLEKEKLCEEAERLAAEPQTDYPALFKKLQADWRKIGPVPKKKDDAIWKRFRAACDQFFHWLEEGQLQNLKRKEELCEEVEKLVAAATPEDNRNEVAARITEIQQQWKEIGPVPLDRKDAIWQRFRRPCDLFFAARQEQFAKDDEQRRLNQARREDLLARAEDLAGREADPETTRELLKIQKEWFAAGPAPREINRELNDRFKNLCDAFFEGRRQFFNELKAQQLANQKKKESLCLLLENILGTTNKSGATGRGKALSLAEELKQAMEDNFMLAGRRDKKDLGEEIKRIEQDWQKIGSVPYKQNQPLTARYKKALDTYYKSLKTK